MLISGFGLVGRVFCSLVSVPLSGSFEGVVAACCLVGNPSGVLIGVAI